MTARSGALVAAVVASAVLLGGCGGDEAAPETTPETTAPDATRFTAAAVERMIVRSTQPTLAGNLGEGSTMEVECDPKAGSEFRCETALYPGGDEASAVRVVYRVECRAGRCEWYPIG